MRSQKPNDFVKNLQQLNESLNGLIKNMRNDINKLENRIAENRRRLHKPYLDRRLRSADLIAELKFHQN